MGAFLFNWLCSVCGFRAELIEIGQNIYEAKDRLWLVDLI